MLQNHSTPEFKTPLGALLSGYKDHKKIEKDKKLLKEIKEQIDQLLFAPYNQGEKLKHNIASVQNIVAKPRSSILALYPINEEDHKKEIGDTQSFYQINHLVNEEQSKIKNDVKSYQKLDISEVQDSGFELNKKGVNLNEIYLRSKCKKDIMDLLNPLNQDNDEPIAFDPNIAVTTSLPNIMNEELNTPSRNYGILKLMAFYKDTKEMPLELESLIDELKLNDNSNLFTQIENLQYIFQENIDNMSDFLEETFSSIAKKLVSNGEQARAKEVYRKRNSVRDNRRSKNKKKICTS